MVQGGGQAFVIAAGEELVDFFELLGQHVEELANDPMQVVGAPARPRILATL